MKKFYSLIAAIALTATVNAQTTLLSEDFASYSAGGNTASSGLAAPSATDVYTDGSNVSTFPTGTKVYAAGGMAKFGSSSVAGSMTTGTLDLSTDGGNFKVTLDAKGWIQTGGTAAGKITVEVTGLTAQTLDIPAQPSSLTATTPLTFNFTGGTANSTITIKTTSPTRAFIDNVMVITTSTLSVLDPSKTKANLVKNTVVANEIIFGAAANVSIYNAAGQMVKTAEVSENSRLDVSALPKGNYIVTGLVKGQAVSQKIIKK
ncbi:MAG: T9SS type A sorting domain-containing protein [Weeksellaceae bacterium]|nr:T9SS type A sorting domain-containing protein [Weeksellaceae bacterium]